jgi:hypothetical protein
MSNFEQFLGGGEKIGEVIPMVSSEMPITFTAGGGSYLRSGYATLNSAGLYDTYKALTYTDAILYTANGTTQGTAPILKLGSNYISQKYFTLDINTTWTAATGGSIPSGDVTHSFIVGTTAVHLHSGGGGLGSLDYSTDDGATYTNVVGNNYGCHGAVNAAGTLGMIIIRSGASTTAGHIYTSTDGITWTSRTPSAAVGNIYSVIWSPVLSAFVIRGVNGVFSTTDGFTLTLLSSWTEAYLASSATSLVAAGNSSFQRSVDGVTWSTSAYFVGALSLYPITRIVYSNSKYIASGANGVVFTSSDDGITWERSFVAFDASHGLSASTFGDLEGALYVNSSSLIKTTASLVVNGVMAKAKAEPTEGYAYVRIG